MPLSLTDRMGAGPGAWLPCLTLVSPHCFPHKLGFPRGLIGRLISSLKLWKWQSGAMWVLEIKSINDLTTAQLSPPLLSPEASSIPVLPPSLPSAFVKVLERKWLTKASVSKVLEALKWKRQQEGLAL